MESVYLNWIRGNRVATYGGIREIPEGLYYSDDYLAMYVPLAEIYSPGSETILEEGKANSRAILIPAVRVNPAKRYRIQVEPNPALFEFADVFHERLIEYGSGSQPKLHVKFRKDTDLSGLDYLVRLYLVG